MNFHILLDAKGRITFAEDDLSEWCGYEPSYFQEKFIYEIFGGLQIEAIENFLQKPLKKLHLKGVTLTAKNGTPSFVELTFTPLPVAADTSTIMVSVHPLDAAAPQSGQQVRQANADLFAGHPFGIIHLDQHGIVTGVNTQFITDTGHNISQLHQQGLLAYVAPKYRSKILRGFIKARDAGNASTFDIEAETSAHRPLPLNLVIVPVVHNGNTVEFYLVLKNISEHVALQKNLKKLSVVADKITDGVMVLNHNFEIEFINEGFTQISGFTYEDAIGRGLDQMLRTGNENAERTADAYERLSNGSSMDMEMQCEKKDGAGYWNLLRMTPIMNEQGAMEMCIVIHTDITEKKMAEMELRLLADDLYRQNKELHQFAYIVSHNMRSPVANIVGLANLLELFKDDPETQNQTLKELTKSVNNLDTVIRDLSYILTVNNATKQLLKEPVNLQDLLQQVLIDLQPQILITDAEMSISSKPLVIRTNRAYLHSIFFNLISNAIKYKSHQTPYIKIDHYQTTEHTVIYVADNGKGIDLNKHGHELFKPYKRFDFKVEGKGLGLFLVKSHIEALGGHLTVKSEVQKGSTFYVKIPLI